MTQNLLAKIELDDVLAKFNIRGRYHAVAAVWLTLGIALDTMWYCDYVLIAEEVKYSCIDDNETYKNGSERSYFSDDQNFRNTTRTRCKDPVPCTQWFYENPDSFVAEFQLACQDWKRTTVGTVHVFGYMLGVILVGSLSDRFGRKTMVIVTGVTGVLCGLAKSFAGYYWIYVTFEFLESSLGDPFSPLFVLGLEMVATESRASYMSSISMGLVIGGMVFPLIKWLVPYWRTCLRVMYTPGLVFILFIYLLDESPRWLLAKGKIDNLVQNMEKAAKLNRIEIEENLSMLSYEEEMSTDYKTVITETFKSRRLLHRFFICMVWWIVGVFVNHGLTINSVFLEGNKYVNFSLTFLMRLPANIIAGYILNKFNRRGPLIMCFLACALIYVGHPFIAKNVLWLVIPVYMSGRMIMGAAYTILHIFTSELFPTYTRNSMQALCSSLGQIGGMVATQMPLLIAYWSGLPIVLYGATLILAALLTLLVPDTAQTSLPDTVHQAEALDAAETRKSQNRSAN